MKHFTFTFALVSAAFWAFAQDTARAVPASQTSTSSSTATQTTSKVNQSSTDGGGIQVGLKVSPGLAMGRVIDKDSDDGVAFSSGGSDFGFSFGPVFDFPMVKQNVYLSTGAWFSLKSIKVKRTTLLSTESSKYNLQYVTVPLAVKFYTNEIAPNLRIYFNLGGTFDIKIAESVAGEDNVGLKEAAQDDDKKLFLAVDGNLLLGTGVQFKVGQTTLFGGISYLRGLVNAVNSTWTVGDTDIKPYQSLALKNNSVTLDLGIMF